MVIAEQRAIRAVVTAREAPPSLRRIWHALEGVADPEIPVVSIVELGMVRAVEWDAADAARLVIRITPTYSGCPATDLIRHAIDDSMRALGVSRLRIDITLSPPWSTDWITADAKRKLREYGIAPPACDASQLRNHNLHERDSAPVEGADVAASMRIDVAGISPLRRHEAVIPCPRCESLRTRLVSQFGSTACKAHYRCEDCREPFDYFKPH